MRQPLQQGTGRLLVTLIVLGMLPLFYLNLIQARVIRQACKPPIEEDCYNVCDNKLYYRSKSTNQCELCITCPAGTEPSNRNPCKAQAIGEEVKCVTCKSGFFSTKEDQDLCVPCTECDKRIVAVECSTTGDKRCGACKPGFYEEYQSNWCILCKDAPQQSDIEMCKDSTTTTAMLTTTQSITETSTEEKIFQNFAGYERRNPGMKKLAEETIIVLVIIGSIGFIVVFGMIICGLVTHCHILQNHDPGYSNSPSHSSVAYSQAVREKNDRNSNISVVVDSEENQINVAKAETIKGQRHETVKGALPEDNSISATASAASETRSASDSEICITPNPLNEIFANDNVANFKSNSVECSSGDESEQELSTLPEDAILPRKHHQKLISYSNKLLGPPEKKPKMRRKSDTSILPLRSDGGLFSSWKTKEEFLDNFQNMLSKKSQSISSSVHSLCSQPKPYKRKLSLHNAASLENKPLEEPQMGSQKGPFAQPEQQQDEHYRPTVWQDSYRPTYPYNAPQKVLPETSHNDNSSNKPGHQNQNSQHSVSKTQHSPPGKVVHIYNGPVITANNCLDLTLAIGDNNNQLQQGASCTKNDKPGTPVAIKCSEEADPFKLGF